MLNICPHCGNKSMQKIDPPAGDSFFIGSCNTKNKNIFATDGITCDAYLCQNCGNIQLKAQRN